jgi:DNA-binding LytR/AlgR family response regulator
MKVLAADQVEASCRPLAGRRALVVEDEYFIGDDLRRALMGLGAEVIGPLPDLAAAQAIVNRSEPIDVALLDINIRDEMIFPLARALRLRKVPIVFTTGYDKTAVIPEFHDIPLLEKPLDVRRMARLLTALTRTV